MIKYASAILVAVCAMVGTGAAEAQQSKINTGHRVPMISAEYRTELPQRPEMQTRDGDYSSCDDSGGGLECGVFICNEFDDDELGSESFCITSSNNESFP